MRALNLITAELRSEEQNALRLFGEAEEVVTRAQSEGRDMSSGEEQAYIRHAKGGDAAKARAEALRAEQHDTLLAMANRPGAAEAAFGNVMLPGLVAVGRGGGRASYSQPIRFGEEFVNYRSGRASLLEAGSVPVGTPLSPTPIADGRQAKFVYELVPGPDAPGGVFAYMRQTARVNNAAVVAPGRPKPTSVYTLERIDDRTQVIAHLSEPVNKTDLDDAPMLTQFLNKELSYGLSKGIDKVLLDAILLAVVSDHSGPALAPIRLAITELQAEDLVPDTIVMNPYDWMSVENAAMAAYAEGTSATSLNDLYAHRLFGVPVMVTNSIAEGQCIVGDFAGSAAVYHTGGTLITIHDSAPREVDGVTVADYALNQLVFRAETRVKAAILRPAGFIQLSTGS
jgi:hypothetical protein